MTELKIGDPAPDFCLPDPERGEICLDDQRGKWVILYFYPKDNTSGCTLEALEFTEAEDEFKEKNAIILAASPDSLRSHTKFRDRHSLTINLLSDIEKDTLQAYGAWQLKKMYGREYMGVQRSTYIVDPEGKITHIWPKVRVKGHVEAVMEKLEELQG